MGEADGEAKINLFFTGCHSAKNNHGYYLFPNSIMKILVADRISPLGVEFLQKQDGFEVIEAYGSTPEQMLELSQDVSAIIVRSDTKVSKEVIAVASKLKAVGRAGVGVDNIDIPAATEKGVIVMNTPGGNTIATAELTFTHMLCGTRPIVRGASGMREGKWERKLLKGAELRGKTLTVLGLGRIGAEVAKRALAFDMKVIAYDPYLTEDRAKELDLIKVDLDEPATNASLYYTATGHGGHGTGDEFVRCEHHVTWDGDTCLSFTPWRDDCASFRRFNPTSGVWMERTYWKGDSLDERIASSDYSRSGWCPGSDVPPVRVSLGDLDAGVHELIIDVPTAQPFTESEMNFWNVAAYLTYERP